MEELELDMKESMDPSEEMLDLCWGIIMLAAQSEGWWVEIMVVGEQESMDRVTRKRRKQKTERSAATNSGSSATSRVHKNVHVPSSLTLMML